MKVGDIIGAIEAFAPLGIQEHWDNSGLVIGSPVALLVQNTDCFAIATPGNWVACAVCCILGFLVAYLLSRLDKSETVQ